VPSEDYVTLAEMERINGRPFGLAGFAWDYGGRVTAWRGGALSRPLPGSCRIGIDFYAASGRSSSIMRSHDAKRLTRQPSPERASRAMNAGHPPDSVARSAMSRRRLLYATTAAVGVGGLAAAAWPFLAQMNPDAATRAAVEIVEVDLAALPAGTQQIVHWHNLPIFVVARTPAMLAAMQEAAFVRGLIDAQSERRQQPAYAKNWHRSLDPAYAVLVGVCTRCGCVPTFFADEPALVVPGGYVCPCCAARYDPAGRTYTGITRYNLPVPPYDIVARSRLRIGRNAKDELFTLEMVEVI